MSTLSRNPIFDVKPAKGLIDQEISIQVANLQPHQKIILRSEIATQNNRWTAFAQFEADSKGTILTTSFAPLEGTYKGVNPMGLIWSMTSDRSSLFPSSENWIDIKFFLEIEGRRSGQRTVRRFPVSSDIQKISIRERGLVASLYLPPSEKPLPVVIVLGGSGGGLSERRAQLLASHGIAAMTLAYFGASGLPESLKNISLEYFETAISWLNGKTEIDSEKMALMGMSRGAELSLLLAAIFPEKIKAVAAYVPSSAIYSSLDYQTPAWIYRGKPLAPNAPFPNIIFQKEQGSTCETAIPFTPFFLEGMKDQRAFEAARIPVEKIQCPVLLVSGQDDQMWPSDLFARQIAERMKAPCTHLSYPGAGHLISPPYFPCTGSKGFHQGINLWLDYGGSPKETAFARADSWKKTLSFLKGLLT